MLQELANGQLLLLLLRRVGPAFCAWEKVSLSIRTRSYFAISDPHPAVSHVFLGLAHTRKERGCCCYGLDNGQSLVIVC